MEAVARATGQDRLARARALAGPILVWAVWGVMTAATILFIRHYSRNIPFGDDFTLVPVMTGHEPLSLRWLWSQHNEHRPLVSRLIMVGLFRFISSDFRVGMYANAALMSATAASMLVLLRRLRGHTSLVDVVLPLSILNIGQAETLLIGFAMNLVLTSWISCELIRLASAKGTRLEWPFTLNLGLLLVLLPLCGGSGLIMLPPLLFWLACDTIWGRTREEDSGRAKVARSIGIGLLVVCLAVVALYMMSYRSAAHIPRPTSLTAVSSTLLEYFSLVVWPNFDAPIYWRVAGLTAVFLVAATLVRLGWVGWRQSDERPRAFAMVAVILAMICAAVAVGLFRAGLGPGLGRSSRYVTTTAPLFCCVYVSWLVYGPARARRLIHLAMILMVILAVPANIRFGRWLGERQRAIYVKIERGMRAHSPISVAVKKSWPALHTEQKMIDESFKMLKKARVGRFGYLVEDSMAEAPNPSKAIR
jgi:hypothetical protein